MGQGQCCCPDGDKGQPVGFEKGPAAKPDIEVPQTGGAPGTEAIDASNPPPPAAPQQDEPPPAAPAPAPKPEPVEEPAPAPAPAPAEPAGPKYNTIKLVREGTKKVGILVGYHDSQPDKSVVREIRDGGLVEAWNMDNIEHQVHMGDQIISVNGVTAKEGKEAILNALADTTKKELIVVLAPVEQDAGVVNES
mmetsp:Transcript_30610/g.55918  ORF Transcript_30610/g.55918 Transcript_30610/m.55918 type:complete len:193 (+) Transcript_30610:109-687(+)